MNRQELVNKLELVYPEVADTNLVPVFTCFMFRAKSIAAYNDSLGIIFKGGIGTDPFAVGGKVLLELLRNTRAEEVTFQVTEQDVVVKTGKSVVRLPYFKQDEFLFNEPKEVYNEALEITPDLLKGIEICLTTSSKDMSQPAIMGVCFNFDLSIKLFSCDGDAITRVNVNPSSGRTLSKAVHTVPNAFCEALLKIAKESETYLGDLELSQNWAKATLLNGITIYGRMIVNDKPLDHAELIKRGMVGKQAFVGVPLGLNEALTRARVLADPESGKTVMTVENGKLRLVTTTHMGDLKDELAIKGHDDVEALVHASLVQRSLEVCDKISIQEGVTAYQLDDTVLIVVGNIGA